MKNFQHYIWMITLVTPTLLMAQPPEEEVAPTAPEFNIEISDLPSGDGAADAVQPAAPAAPATVQAQQIQPALPTAILGQATDPTKIGGTPSLPQTQNEKEDKSIKGITLSPSFAIKPIGLSNAENANGQNYVFFEVHPGLTMVSNFKTSQGRDVNVSLNYEFTWQEYLNGRDFTKRYFEHEFDTDISLNWTKNFGTGIHNIVDYSLFASTERGYTVFDDASILGDFKINDQVTFSTGYRAWFFNLSDATFRLSDGTVPSDPEEFLLANSAGSGGNPFFNDPFNPNVTIDSVVGNVWFINNGLKGIVAYKPVDGTNLKLDYEYVFATFSNDPGSEWTGHWITPSISQKMPWKGGKVALKDQLRLRSYTSKVNGDGSSVQNLRNRFSITFDQDITSNITAEVYWRLWALGSNADNYSKLNIENEAYLGFKFGF